MRYSDFERIVSEERMRRYVEACGGDTRKAMTLYRYNLQLSKELHTVICCFEVALRNAIDAILSQKLGCEWLKDSIVSGGRFDTPSTQRDFNKITRAYQRLLSERQYSHSKLLASMDFGFWKYLFSPVQFHLTNESLLGVFPQKERSSAQVQYNHSYIFNELDKINTLRNRVAHHEPVCFYLQSPVIYTAHIKKAYERMQRLFLWMGINSGDFLYGVDHVQAVCEKIEKLKPI